MVCFDSFTVAAIWRALCRPSVTDWLLVVITFGGVATAIGTLRTIAREVTATEKAAKAAADSVAESQRATGIAAQTAGIALQNLRTNQEIERAYIRLIDSKESSLDEDSLNGEVTGLTFKLELTNAGRTPGDVLGGFLGWCIAAAPVVPDLTRAFRPAPAHLGPADKLPFEWSVESKDDKLVKIALDGGEPLKEPPDHIWLMGEVHYKDRFDNPHIAGFCRRVNIHAHAVVLGIDQQTGPFNFDSPMGDDRRRHYGLPLATKPILNSLH